RGYLTAILELFSYATRPQLGMSQASSRRMAKQRMKGAFMRERTTFLGRAAALMLAVIMLVGCFTTACQSAPVEVEEAPELEVVNAQTEPLIDIDGDGLEDTITVDTDNTADENFTPETAKATLTVKLGRGETITQEIPGWWQNAEYHTADFDADNRTDIALMLWVGGSNYDATNVYVYHMGNSKLTELAKNVITNESITYDQSKYSALNGENTHWVSGGTVISEGGKSKLRLRQLLDYDPGAGIATAYYTNLVWNGSGWFIESMEIGEAFGEEQIYPDTLQYAPMPPDPIDTLSDMDLLIYSSLTNNSKVYALPRTLSGNDLSTSIWDNILLTVNDRYFDGKPYDAAGAAYNVVQVRYNDDGTIDVYLILSYRQYDILNDELSVTGELNCAVIWQYKENESGEIEFSNVYWPIKDSKGRVSYANKNWPEDLQKYLEFSPDSIGRAERLKAIDEQIAISIDNNEKVDALLSTIVSGPKGSSAPIDYIHEHVGEYGQLCAMGRRAVSRFMPRFEAGKETGLEGQIMAAVLNALTGADSVYNYENGQEWYDDNRNEMLAYLQTAVQPTPALDASNPEWQAAKRIAAPFSETGKRIDLSYYEVSIDLNGTERTSTMTENNVTPDRFDRTDEGQTLLMVDKASADAINDSSRLGDLITQFQYGYSETVTEFIQLDHTAYFDADSPVYRMDKMTSVMDIAEPGWNDTAYTTYFVYLTPQWDYRGQTQSQNIVLGFRFVNAVRGDIGGWKLLQTEADCEKWMGTVEFGDAFASMPKPTPTPASTELANAIVTDAKALVGKPYKKGTYGPDTFDSSGLVHYVITQAGVYVERMENCQRYADNANWQKIEDKAKLQPGDIMFFYGGDTEKIQHAGIYIGDGKMIDASSANGKVTERSWETDYWQEHFAFARRVA
ncbi:MAG: C40 family peptidase, partial [Clostridia bacterium]|nr:C40 family peptidase [Clostridia bacterium]